MPADAPTLGHVGLTRAQLLARGAAGAAALAVGVPPAAGATRVSRRVYVFTDGALDVYDVDRGFAHVRRTPLPMLARGVRGAAGSAATGQLHVAYGGNGGENGNGSLLRFDLRAHDVVWTRDYPFGVDSHAVGPAGQRLYLPDGALSEKGRWHVVDARDGRVLRAIRGDRGAHNTIVSRDGRRVYLGGRDGYYLFVADTRTGRTLRRVGRFQSGVRPFTVNRRETLAFVTVTNFLGFQVASLVSGRVLHTVAVEGFDWDQDEFEPDAPSHGISLAPDERTLWVMDGPNSHVHVYDVRGLPRAVPRKLASIRVHPLTGRQDPCAYACAKDGWLSHTRDGRHVLVGDAGDVIDTRTRRIVRHLEPLANTRKFIEVHFDGAGRVVWVARSRSSVA